MDFTIDDQYFTSIHVHKEYSTLTGNTEDDIIKKLKGYDKMSSHSFEDHPEFTRLRDRLEQEGYIRTQRNCWNGDDVIKRFTLNGYIFQKNERFPCGAAMSGHLKYTKKRNKKRNAKI